MYGDFKLNFTLNFTINVQFQRQSLISHVDFHGEYAEFESSFTSFRFGLTLVSLIHFLVEITNSIVPTEDNVMKNLIHCGSWKSSDSLRSIYKRTARTYR
uniref:Uncharacterized protein n=1 Tax=Romanomermis culicivorax TaxID=13658 RepID=A0A915IIG8_ROMCU